MLAREAAKIFHDWAFEEGLMPDGPREPVTSTAADLALIDPITEAGKLALRAKVVQAVSFNEAKAEVVVFTKRTALSKKAATLVPTSVDNVAITYRQGAPEPLGPALTLPFGGPAYVTRVSAGTARYTCGSSISSGNFRDAGTLGALVRDAQGVLFGLSNNHVTGQCSFAEVGLPIIAPGVFDVAANSLPPFTLGFHGRSLPMIPGSADNIDPHANIDAAIFRIRDEDAVSSYQRAAYDTPGVAAPLAAGVQVEKVGRTTGHTHGNVIAQVLGAHPISYTSQLHNFSGNVSFEPVFAITGVGAAFSEAGDSGSLITTLENGQRKAVGIVVGGMSDSRAPGGFITIALAIEPILLGFGVTLVTGHNV